MKSGFWSNRFCQPNGFAIILAFLLGLSAGITQAQEAIKPFRLTASDKQQIEYQPGTDSLTVVCFLGTECPMVKLYAKRLSEYAERYRSQRVRFIGVNSNRQDSLDEIAVFVKETGLGFPIGKDYQNQVADDFQATRTPEVFLLNQDGKIIYRGRIDDQFSPGITRGKIKQNFLTDAIDSALADQTIETASTKAEGCLIGRVTPGEATTEITFAREVSRILQSHCVECHRDGQIGPMSLTDYDEVVGWGEMIVEVIDDQRMPPWHASSEFGSFSNARQMPEADKQTIRDWVAGGMPMGQSEDMPKPLEFTEGWRLEQDPDLVLSMRNKPFRVPADGTVEYQYFLVDPKFETDRWVKAAEVIPGNRSVVHHSIVFIRPPDGSAFRGTGWLAAYVPGQSPPAEREGFATRIPAGSKLVFQQHYTPNGSTAEDITQVGLVFADPEEVTHEVFTLIGLDQEFEIQPNESHHEVQLQLPWFPSDGILLSAAPHMHYRGKSFDLFAQRGDQTEQILKVPRYDFNWQHSYRFSEPIPLKEIDEIHFSVAFDNSASNPFNPDASQYVTWGDQTWEEMAVAFFNVAQPLSRPVEPTQLPETTDESLLTNPEEPAELKPELVKKLDEIFKKHDKNGDGRISRGEVQNVLKHYGFYQLDANDDDFISREEWAQAMRNRSGGR